MMNYTDKGVRRVKKILFISIIILLIALLFVGCKGLPSKFYFIEQYPELSFNSYIVTQEPIKDSETEITIGYTYTVIAEILNSGIDGQFLINLAGKEDQVASWEAIGDYGPVNIETGTKAINLIFENYDINTKYKTFKIELYVIENNSTKRLDEVGVD